MTFLFFGCLCTMVLMVCKPTIVLGYLCPGLYLVRLLGELLADMGPMLTKFGVPRIVQP